MAIAFVNNVGKAANNTASQTTVTVTPLQNCGAGNLLVAVVGFGGTNVCTSVTDTKGNTWTIDKTQGSTGNPCNVATTIQNAGALTTGDTITFTGGSGANKAVVVREFSSTTGWAASRLDQVTGQDGTTSTALTSGASGTTTQAAELVVGGFTWAGTSTITMTKGAAYVDVYEADEGSGAFISAALEYQIVSATGAQTADGTLSAAPTSTHSVVATYFAVTTASSGPPGSPIVVGAGNTLLTIPGSNPLAILQPALPANWANQLIATDPATAVVSEPAPQVTTSGDPAVFPLVGLLGWLPTIPGTAVLLAPQAPGDFPLSSLLLVPPATATAGQAAVSLDVRVLTDPAAATESGPAPQVTTSGDPAVFPLIPGLLGPLLTIPGTAVLLKPQDWTDPPSFGNVVAPPATATAGQVTPAVQLQAAPTPATATASGVAPAVTVTSVATYDPIGQPLLAIPGDGIFIPGSRVRLRDQQLADPAAPGTGPQLVSVPPAGATVSTQNLGWLKSILDVQTPSGSSSPSTLTIPAGTTVPAGDTILVAVEYSTVVRTVSSVTDTQGNTYTVDSNLAGANTAVALCSTRVTNPLSAGDVITITMSGPTTAGRIHAALWYGGFLSSYVDAAAFGTATNLTSSPGTVTGAGATAQANEVVIGLAGLDFNASAASIGGYTQRVNAQSGGTVRTLVVADSMETVANTKAFTASWTGTLAGSAFILGTYKAATGLNAPAIPQVTVSPAPRTTTVTAPAPQVFWPQAIVLSVPPATALVQRTVSTVNNLGVTDTVNEIIRPTQYHQAPLQTYSHGVAVVAGQFTFSSAYQLGGDAFTLPPAFQQAIVVTFHPTGGYVFEYTGSTVKAYLGGVEASFGTPLNTLGPIPYIAYVVRGQ